MKNISKLAETLESVLKRWPELRTRQMLPAYAHYRDVDGLLDGSWEGEFEYVPEYEGERAFPVPEDEEDAVAIADLLTAVPELLALLKQLVDTGPRNIPAGG